MEERKFECDVLVIGTGASGMATAVTAAAQGLEVLVVDKEPRYGGTTARSGGWLWIPGTRLATEQGIKEPAGAARTYLQHEATTHFDAARVDAFLANGPKAIDFFTRETCVQFDMPPVFPDYHAEAPGGQQGGRSMVTRPFDGRELGPRIKQLAPPLPELTVFGMMLGSGKEIWHFMRAFESLESFFYVAKRLGRHFLDVVRYGRGMTLTNGNALAGRLAKAAMDHDIPVWLSSPVRKLIVEGDAVVGAIVDREGRAPVSTPASVSCSPAEVFRTTSNGARRSFPMRPPVASTTRLRRKPTRATGCAWPRRWAAKSIPRFRTRPHGCRRPSRRAPMAARA